VVLESADYAGRRGAPVRAELLMVRSWRGNHGDWHRDIPAPTGRAAVFRARAGKLAPPPAWEAVAVRCASPGAGDHEGLGGIALLAALGALDAQEIDSALVLGTAPDRGYALLLAAPTRRTFQRRRDSSHVHH
jgi:3-oxoacyl-[acyl-carrier-protein] synthase II